MKKLELRNFNIAEFRAQENEKGDPSFQGYASVFNSPSDLGGFIEEIAPSAFTKTLKENKQIKALVNHDSSMVLGSVKSGTLALTVDDIGLRFSIDPPDTSYSRDLQVSVTRGDIDQCSFGFYVIADKVEKLKDGKIKRTILECKLIEVSIVAFPAFADTSVSLRDIFSTDEEFNVFSSGATNYIEQETKQLVDTESTVETRRQPFVQPSYNPKYLSALYY